MSSESEKLVDSDKPVVSNLLCFVSSARHTMPTNDIVNCCLPFYDLTQVKDAKDLLCTFLKEKPVRRRGDNAKMSEIMDIFDIFNKLDEKELFIPKFLCDSYKGMPPLSGYEMIAPMLTTLIIEITDLKEEIKLLKSKSNIDLKLTSDTVQIKSNVQDIKNDINSLKMKINDGGFRKSRSDDLDNLIHSLEKDDTNIHACNPDTSKNYSTDCAVGTHTPSAPNLSQMPCDDDCFSFSQPSPLQISNNKLFSGKVFTNSKSYSDTLRINIDSPVTRKKPNKVISNFQNKDKRRNKEKSIFGTKKISTDMKIKPAQRLYDIYVGNFDPSTDCSSLKDYIENDLDIKITSIEQLETKNKFIKSFKVSAPLGVRNTLLDHSLWPEGVKCHKFYNR